MLNAALIGYGGIARTHRNGYFKLEQEGKVRLVAACDIRPDVFQKEIQMNIQNDSGEKGRFHCYTNLEEMLTNEEIDFVDICIPSYLHRKMAIQMMERGYHVLSEKPMALNAEDCNAMLAAEKKSGKCFMIGQCLRFFPEYDFLKTCIEKNTYGKPLSAFFSRLSMPPKWGWQNWFMDYEKSGGCVTDLHIHDIDMVRYLFGEPDAVSCRAADTNTRYDLVQTALFYGGMPVTAVGEWAVGHLNFSANYQVNFENATVVYENGKVLVYNKDGSDPTQPELDSFDGYTGEISYFCDVIEGKTSNLKNPASSAAKTVKLIEILKESADHCGVVIKLK